MKKLLLVVGLVVLFFAQSSYAYEESYAYRENGNYIDFFGNSSGAKWRYHEDFIGVLEKNSVDRKLRLDLLDDNNAYCFDFFSKTFFNIDRCEEIKFEIWSKIKKEPENTKRVLKFMKLVIQDFCEDAIIKNFGKIQKEKNIFTSGKTIFTVKCPKVLANRKAIEDSQKIAQQEQEQEMTKEKEEELLASVQAKRELCFAMGFEDGTEPLANCILQLMLSENKKNEQQQVVVTSGNDGLAGAMDEQTRILSKQLRIQKIQLNRENLKRSIYMMNTGKIPTW